MAIEDALRQLEAGANAEIAWAFGDVLRLWATRENWRDCLLLQHLERNERNLTAWNELVRRTRRALANDAELQTKARALLSPPSIRFNDVMDDFIAEMLAAQYLQVLGHTEIVFLPDDNAIHTDLQSRCGDHTCVTEAKNLREPRGLTKIAVACWNRNRAATPERYEFTAELVDLDDPLSDLSVEQEAAVIILVNDLPGWERPCRRIRDLPGGRRISARVSDGRSVIAVHGGGPFRLDGVDGVLAQGQRGLILKLLEHTRKALGQLYAEDVPSDFRRLLYVRWKPPEQFVVAPDELNAVRAAVQDGLQTFADISFPHFAIAITHTGENPDQTPRVEWD